MPERRKAALNRLNWNDAKTLYPCPPPLYHRASARHVPLVLLRALRDPAVV